MKEKFSTPRAAFARPFARAFRSERDASSWGLEPALFRDATTTTTTMGSDEGKKAKKAKKAKKEKKEKRDRVSEEDAEGKKRAKKRMREETSGGGDAGEENAPTTTTTETGEPPAPGTFPTSKTKVYCGNLSWNVDEQTLIEAFKDCGEVESVTWFEEKATGKFLGAGVVEFKTPEGAAKAVAACGRKVLGRETPTRFWEQRGNTAEERAAAKAAAREAGGGQGDVKKMGPKPDGCYTLFMGNLNFQIDDDKIWKFFMDNAEVEPTTVRWLTNKETGEFRGVGFADFADDESLDAAAKCNGLPCMGRPIRLDWQAPSNRG